MKLKFASLGTALSRDEAKMVKGGDGAGSPCAFAAPTGLPGGWSEVFVGTCDPSGWCNSDGVSHKGFNVISLMRVKSCC